MKIKITVWRIKMAFKSLKAKNGVTNSLYYFSAYYKFDNK